MVADRREITMDGSRRPAMLESDLSAQKVWDALTRAFSGFTALHRDRRHAAVAETRDGEVYRLASTLVTFAARRPSQDR